LKPCYRINLRNTIAASSFSRNEAIVVVESGTAPALTRKDLGMSNILHAAMHITCSSNVQSVRKGNCQQLSNSLPRYVPCQKRSALMLSSNKSTCSLFYDKGIRSVWHKSRRVEEIELDGGGGWTGMLSLPEHKS